MMASFNNLKVVVDVHDCWLLQERLLESLSVSYWYCCCWLF